MVRERSFTLIILIELLLVSSSGLLSIGYVIFTSPEESGMLSRLSSLVYVAVVTNTRLQYESALGEGRISHTFYDSRELAMADFREGLVDAVLVGDIYSDERESVVEVIVPSNSPKTPLTKLALKRVLVRLEDRLREHKVESYAPELSFASYELMDFHPQARHVEVYFIFTLPLLLFLPCVVSGSLAIDTLTQDLESKRILNLVSAPLTPAQIVFGKAAAAFILSLSQCILWLTVLSSTFVSPANHMVLILLCGLYTVAFMNAGSLLALFLKKMRSSQILYTFISMSAISLFSPFANLHPLLLANSPSHIITRIALGASATEFTTQLSALIILALASTIAVYAFSRKVADP